MTPIRQKTKSRNVQYVLTVSLQRQKFTDLRNIETENFDFKNQICFLPLAINGITFQARIKKSRDICGNKYN